MNQKIVAGLLVLSALFSSWLYWGSDLKVEQVLTAKEWQSKMVTVITDSLQEESVGPLRKVEVTSNVKYLPNGSYIRVATVRLYANNAKNENIISISEIGEWDISDNYLLVSPSEFKDVSSAQSKDFTADQLKLITQIFKMDAQQSRRIDIVNEKTLLLTSLSHGSTVLFSN
ncbi:MULTISPECIES: regulatory protein ToxS [Vibrio]|uniref:Regulatory protein ToxS n=1 Tax=Vibrio neptunius TaxID=170651 RepID=A0ABS2ZY49_9VIBR|nr:MULTISPECIES: regulatory protein ToxS [Vibrio]KJY92714.1 membrane protein [Vibrio neptunius]MBN3494574.1 regulatory protein ToxS [Vibrio neptunius]MBN3513666.1 regulatory protein ToxS [Vibrio neptunius]MBN3548007.1 regulatory protein ToxS [Vibrio neptunius]MBN3575138.1 regulatory protein ToxS [Vibrio neptunius]